VHSVALRRHPPDTALHPLPSIAGASGMLEQVGKCRVFGKDVTNGTVGSTQAAEFSKTQVNLSEEAGDQHVNNVTTPRTDLARIFRFLRLSYRRSDEGTCSPGNLNHSQPCGWHRKSLDWRRAGAHREANEAESTAANKEASETASRL
jgi:hypothetical protein